MAKVTGRKKAMKAPKNYGTLKIESHDNGGHTVHHSPPMPPRNPNMPFQPAPPTQTASFGPNDHGKMMNHVKGITGPDMGGM